VTLFAILAFLLAAGVAALLAWPLFRPGAAPEGTAKPSRPLAAAIAVWVPLAGFGLYFTLSDWPWDQPEATAASPHGSEAATLESMASQLEQRLLSQPGDPEGWKLLGRTYVVMGNYAKAAEAYGKAAELAGDDVEALLGVAEARVLADESQFRGEAGGMFERAAGMAPDNPKALWYAGLTAYQKQDLATARERWTALKALSPPPELLQVVDARIAEIDAAIGPAAGGAAPVVATEAARTAPAAAATPTEAEPAAADGAIPLRIVVAPALAGQVPPGAPLFVLARSSAGGPPLAAVRRSSSELPLAIALSDANAMIQGTSLTQVDDLLLVARVSLTGRPVQSKGDLYGQVRYDPAAKGPITVTIDRVAD
jgi:cytochrome c-type biogenesis protein CcmH